MGRSEASLRISELEASQIVNVVGKCHIVDVIACAYAYGVLLDKTQQLFVLEQSPQLEIVKHTGKLILRDITIFDSIKVLETREQLNTLLPHL